MKTLFVIMSFIFMNEVTSLTVVRLFSFPHTLFSIVLTKEYDFSCVFPGVGVIMKLMS